MHEPLGSEGELDSCQMGLGLPARRGGGGEGYVLQKLEGRCTFAMNGQAPESAQELDCASMRVDEE